MTVLLPYQQRWIADQSIVKVAEKSRQIGFSWTEAADSALSAAENKYDSWYVGYNQDMAQEFIKDVAFWAKSYQLSCEKDQEECVISDERKDILAYRIRFASGKRVTALSSKPNNLRGKRGRVIIDEAAFHEDLKELLKAAMALLMWGGKVSIMSTHDGIDSDFNELIEDIKKGKKPYSLHRVTLDDALRDGLYERIAQKTEKPYSLEAQETWRSELIEFYGESADEELFCIPTRSGQNYFPRILVENCMSKDLDIVRWSLKDDFLLLQETEKRNLCDRWLKEHIDPILEKFSPYSQKYLGQDFARNGDLSVIMISEETQNLEQHVRLTIELRNIPFDQQRQIVFYLCDNLPNFAGGAFDARGNGQYLAETTAIRYPGRIYQIMISRPWYREAFPKYKAAFEDQKILLPLNADILQDHRIVKIEKGDPTIPDKRFRGADGGYRHGDAAIAGCLLWWASIQNNIILLPPTFSIWRD